MMGFLPSCLPNPPLAAPILPSRIVSFIIDGGSLVGLSYQSTAGAAAPAKTIIRLGVQSSKVYDSDITGQRKRKHKDRVVTEGCVMRVDKSRSRRKLWKSFILHKNNTKAILRIQGGGDGTDGNILARVPDATDASSNPVLVTQPTEYPEDIEADGLDDAQDMAISDEEEHIVLDVAVGNNHEQDGECIDVLISFQQEKSYPFPVLPSVLLFKVCFPPRPVESDGPLDPRVSTNFAVSIFVFFSQTRGIRWPFGSTGLHKFCCLDFCFFLPDPWNPMALWIHGSPQILLS